MNDTIQADRSVPYVGTVVDGILNAGQVKIGDSILIGPDSNGNFMPTAVRDIHRKRSVNFSFFSEKSVLAVDDMALSGLLLNLRWRGNVSPWLSNGCDEEMCGKVKY